MPAAWLSSHSSRFAHSLPACFLIIEICCGHQHDMLHTMIEAANSVLSMTILSPSALNYARLLHMESVCKSPAMLMGESELCEW